jgi:hypothetical protein
LEKELGFIWSLQLVGQMGITWVLFLPFYDHTLLEQEDLGKENHDYPAYPRKIPMII